MLEGLVKKYPNLLQYSTMRDLNFTLMALMSFTNQTNFLKQNSDNLGHSEETQIDKFDQTGNLDQYSNMGQLHTFLSETITPIIYNLHRSKLENAPENFE